MLWSALTSLWRWGWWGDVSDDVTVAERPSLHNLYGDDNSTIEPLASDERRWFEGVVVSVSESGAAISGALWCPAAEAGVCRLSVGQRVRGEAFRRSWRHGWIVRQVELVETFDTDSQPAVECAGAVIVHVWRLEGRTMVAAASCAGGGAAAATAGYGSNQSVYRIEQNCAVIDFKPHVGDWLVMSPLGGADVTLPFDIGGDVKVKLEALRRWTLSGTVTYVSRAGPHCSVVDDQVYFTPSAWCAPGQQPRCGDTVRCLCIENTMPSQQQQQKQQQQYPSSSWHRLKKLQWRATHVSPLGTVGWQLSGRRDGDYNTALDDCVTVVPGVPALRHARHVFVSAAQRLSAYKVPQQLARCLDTDGLEQLLASCPQLAEPLTADNYRQKLSTLLFIEESEQRRQLRRYSMENVAMTTTADGCLQLNVPGLADGRPSLVVGDRALLSHPDLHTGIVYEGCIHQVRQSAVLLRFCDDFHTHYTGQEYNVQFDFSRTRWRHMHRAVDTAVSTCLHQILLVLPSVSEKCYYQKQQRPPQVEFDVESVSDDGGVTDEDDGDESSTDGDDDGDDDDFQCNNSDDTQQQQQQQDSISNGVEAAESNTSVNGRAKLIDSGSDVADSRSGGHHGNNSAVTTLNNAVDSNKSGTTVENGALLGGCLPDRATSETGIKSAGKRTTLRWFNRRLNERQRRAVCRVLRAECRPLPYIIYGPPGTGKTVTLVECVLQLYTLLPHSRLLIVAASNSAADVITGRLVRSSGGILTPAVLSQLCAYNRDVSSCTDSLVRQYLVSQSGGGGDTAAPRQPPAANGCLEAVCRRRLVVATAATCGQLWRLEVGAAGMWTHVLVDEAGCLTEPELLVPIALMYSGGGMGGGGQLTTALTSGGGQLVLVGDPKQLGAVLQSSAASVWGLSVSLLERLSEHQLYSRQPQSLSDSNHTNQNQKQQQQRFDYDPRLLTKLVNNYRSHRHLLHVPSHLFYDGELVACASRRRVNALCNRIAWCARPDRGRRRGFPLLFVGVRGQCLQEDDSPSWFNPAELFVVLTHLQRVLAAGVAPDDIGIIAPYRKHALKLRELIARFSLPSVRVGSAEEFQGQEREVILLTTVRSGGTVSANNDTLNSSMYQSQHRHMGFMCQPKRFNVCVTRARSLMVVIGCPDLLARDPCWGYLLRYAVQHGAYTGCSWTDSAGTADSRDESADPSDSCNTVKQQSLADPVGLTADLSVDSPTSQSADLAGEFSRTCVTVDVAN